MDDISLIEISKQIGSLEQRMNSFEKYLMAVSQAKTEEEDLSKFNYPMLIDYDSAIMDNPNIINHFRTIKSSGYKVSIAKPYPSENGDPPMIFVTQFTRDELDRYIAGNPGTNYGEYIFKIEPLYEENL